MHAWIHGFGWYIEIQMKTHTLKISPRFIVPSKRFEAESVAKKHFGWESLHAEPSYCLDVVVYLLKCVFGSDIQLKIEFGRWAHKTIYRGFTHER